MANGFPRGWNYDPPPYQVNPDISVQYELQFGRDLIRPGAKLKFKGVRGAYVFKWLAHNSKLDSTWIDCYDSKTGELRSFYLAKLKAVVRPKRSRRKKIAQLT